MGFLMENYRQAYQKLSGILANFEAELAGISLPFYIRVQGSLDLGKTAR